MPDVFGQTDFDVRLEWGPVGARATRGDVAVIVDVLSFSTSVTIAVERGMTVYPYGSGLGGVDTFAAERHAVVAVGRLIPDREGVSHAPSLSPAAMLESETVRRVVLPSPNGSAIASSLCDSATAVVAGCLRNADALGRWLDTQLATGRCVAVVPAGERWSQDKSLRPALEDHLGAGAILASLKARGHEDRMSPEAQAAVAVFETAQGRLTEQMLQCVSGRELIARGFRRDVEVAAELSVSSTVPFLADGAFRPWGSTG